MTISNHASNRAVLIVGNCTDDREMYADYLRQQGLRVIETDHGRDALAFASTVHVVITDPWLNDGLDGVEFITRVRTDERTKQFRSLL